ncbi:MAG: isocitrate dehydrogenase, partial [Alphaproteobacteria bacterium]|nr:isocitrate dehydrogenase [Alphaproteobacteria bacterium]
NGDILSDLGSGLIGGLGFAPGANIGDDYAIFEAVHGSAPKYAGTNTINPTAVLLSGVMMLRYIGEFDAARMIEQALYLTLARDGYITRDVKVPGKDPVSTTTFTDQILKNLGQNYNDEVRHYKPIGKVHVSSDRDFVKTTKREVVGADIFIETTANVGDFGALMEKLADQNHLKLKLITCRGVKVYPFEHGLFPEVTDVVRCRFIGKDAGTFDDKKICELLSDIEPHHSWMHIEKLQSFDGVPGYSKAHGED